jgi:hypothetical protein
MPGRLLKQIGFPAHFFWFFGFSVGVLMIVIFQPWYYPTLLFDDTAELAQHFLSYQHSHPESGPISFPYVSGLMTYLGALVLCACASVCFFASMLLRQRARHKTQGAFFLHVGCLTLVLACDDLLLVGDQLALYDPHAKILMQAAYALYVAWIFINFRAVIHSFRIGPLLVSLLLLALAISFDKDAPLTSVFGCTAPVNFFRDTIQPDHWDGYQLRAVFEEGFKWLGFVAWSCAFTHMAFEALGQRAEHNPS